MVIKRIWQWRRGWKSHKDDSTWHVLKRQPLWLLLMALTPLTIFKMMMLTLMILTILKMTIKTPFILTILKTILLAPMILAILPALLKTWTASPWAAAGGTCSAQSTDSPSLGVIFLKSISMASPLHNVHFVKYDGPVVKSWNPKIHFLMGKKYFWGHFSYVVLGRKL